MRIEVARNKLQEIAEFSSYGPARSSMAGYIHPIASGTGGLEFSRLQAGEIKRISVKRIHVTPALDSMLGPIPGGLHDLALGAISALDAK
jgi:hypothetical protein